MQFYKLSASPADNDNVGVINFYGNDDGENKTLFGKILVESTDVTNGTEDGKITLYSMKAGTSTASLTISSGAVTCNVSLDIAGSGATVTGILDEDDMSSNSAVKLATQQSIKAYVDTAILTTDTWQEVMTNGNTFYVASNDGNPQMRMGATDAEELHIQCVYDSSAQTLDYVLFQTDAASGTAHKGEFRFNVDGTEIFHVNDAGVNIVSGKAFYINDTSVLNATTLGGAVVNSSLTSVGTLTTLTVDNVIVNGTTIGHTSDTDLMTLASGVLTVAGEISVTTLDIGGTNVTSTAAELNYVDVTAGTAVANKAVVLGSSKEILELGAVGCGAITSTGDSTFDSTTLVVDSSNNRVGIGIGSPTVSLDVTKSGSSNYVNVSDGTVFNYFGVSNSGVIGTIGTVTNHPIRFDTNNTERMRISNAGLVLINDSANANSTIGLTINQDANDNEILSFKSSDVNHGVTGVTETDTWGFFKKNSGNSGGLFGSFLSDATEPVLIQAIETTTTSTAKSTSVSGSISLRAGKANGTAVGNLDSNANIFTLRAFKGGAFSTVFIVDEDGDLFADGGTASTDMVTLYDQFSDAELIRTLEIARSENGAKGFVRSAHDDFIKYNEDTLVHAGILGAKIKDGGMLNVTGLQRLHSGAIWQIYRENQRLKQSLKSIESHTKKIEKKLELLDLKV